MLFEEIRIRHLLKIDRQRILRTGLLIPVLAELLTISLHIFCWRIIGNINVRVVIQICEVRYLVPVTVACISNSGQVILRKI